MNESSEQRLAEAPKGVANSIPTGADITGMYAGEVELVVVAPVDLKMVAKLYACLQAIPELKILHTEGSLSKGAVISVAIGKPMPIIKLISSKLSDIEIIPESIQKGSVVEERPGLRKDGKLPALHRLKIMSKRA